MKTIIGIVLILVGGFLGLYLGIWWAFIGGIVTIIKQFQSPHVDVLSIAFGILKIVLATPIGWFSALVLVIPGFVFLAKADL